MAGNGSHKSFRDTYSGTREYEGAGRYHSAVLHTYFEGGKEAKRVLRDDGVLVFNAGDSRVYRVGDDGLTVLSHDHSLVQSLLDHGEITPEQAARHPYRNIVEGGLGGTFARAWHPGKERCFATTTTPLAPGEALLVCSDGVNDTLNDAETAACLGHPPTPEGLHHLAERLAEESRDNFAAVLIQPAG